MFHHAAEARLRRIEHAGRNFTAPRILSRVRAAEWDNRRSRYMYSSGVYVYNLADAPKLFVLDRRDDAVMQKRMDHAYSSRECEC